MLNDYKKVIASALIASIAIVGCGDSVTVSDNTSTNDVVGYLYTSTNGENGNTLLKLDRYTDGTVKGEVAYQTNGPGGANIGAGGAARGDFDSQGAIQIIGDYLLVVNAGATTADNTNGISVFKIDKTTGTLSDVKTYGSKGTRPVSITYTKKSTGNDYWVVVGNQWNNPNVQGDEPLRYPPTGFHDDNNSLDSEVPGVFAYGERNIVSFTFNPSTGVLSDGKNIDNYVARHGGPTTVAFSDDGSKLAVSTWGISHFGTENVLTTEQGASNIHVYDFNNVDGAVSSLRTFEKEGIAGSIGMNWAKNSTSILHVSNFNLTPALRNRSLTILRDNGSAVSEIDYKGTGTVTGDNDEACWTLLNPDGNKLYVASFGTNVITSFDLDANGEVTNAYPSIARGGEAPAGDTKDMYITSDNKNMYVLGAYQTFSLNTFSINADGPVSYDGQYKYTNTPDDDNVENTAGVYNFLGLTGFTK